MDRSGLDEALALLRRGLSATEEALAAIAALEQLQERFEVAVLPLVENQEVWQDATRSQAVVRGELHNVRGCLEELLQQLTENQAQETQTRAWADQLLNLNGRLQSALTNAGQSANEFYQTLRPTLITFYLKNASRSPRWAETWPRDAEAAPVALERIAAETATLAVDDLDVNLARFRWNVGWSQAQIAELVGLSQPSIAARLARIEALISLEVSADHVRQLAAADRYEVANWHVPISRFGRSVTGADMLLRSKAGAIQLEFLVAGDDGGAGRRPTAAMRAGPLDFRLRLNERRRSGPERAIGGVAIYFRERGVVGFYTLNEMVDLWNRFGSLSIEMVLPQLIEIQEPAWSLADLVKRADKRTTTSE